MAAVIIPLLKQGHSPYQMLANYSELNISEKTLYNYIESGVFHEITGITSRDLRRQVSRKLPTKKTQAYKKRKDNKYLEGRAYRDYKTCLSGKPDVNGQDDLNLALRHASSAPVGSLGGRSP